MTAYMILLFNFLIVFPLFSQSGEKDYALFEVLYSYEMPSSERTLEDQPREYREALLMATEHIKKYEARLIFNQQKAVFKSPEILTSSMADIFINASTLAGHSFYYNSVDDLLILQKPGLGGLETMTYDQEIQWEITDATAIINGLLCIKAIGTRSVKGFNDDQFVAWFLPDMPYPFGPLYANGLTGLILKLRYPGTVITAKSIRLISNQREEIEFPNGKKLRTYSETFR